MISLTVLVSFFLYQYSYAVYDINWNEVMNSQVHNYVVKTTFYEKNDFFDETGYVNIHQFEDPIVVVDNRIYCDVHANRGGLSVSSDFTLGFESIEQYLKLSRLYFAPRMKERILLLQYPNGYIPKSFIISLQNEISAWNLFKDRIIDLKDMELPPAEEIKALNCLNLYTELANRTLNYLSRVNETREAYCLRDPNTIGEDSLNSLLNDEKLFLPSELWQGRKIQFFSKFLVHYLTNSIKPYLESPQFCSSHRNFTIVHVETEAAPAMDDYKLPIPVNDGENKEILFITDRCQHFDIAMEVLQHDFELAASYFPDRRVTPESYDYCTRRVYVSLGAWIPGDSLIPTVGMNWKAEDSGGSMTERNYYCPRNSHSIHNQCIPSILLPVNYFQVMLQAMYFSPEILLQNQLLSVQSDTSGRALLMGLGGAMFNTYLVTKFPQLEMEHLELRDSIIHTAKDYFFFDRYVCADYQLMKTTEMEASLDGITGGNPQLQSSLMTMIPRTAINNTNNHSSFIHSKKSSCKSIMIEADAFDYLDWLVAAQEGKKHLTKYLDLIRHFPTEKEYMKGVMDFYNHGNNMQSQRSTIEQLVSQDFRTEPNSINIDLFYDYVFIDIFDGIVNFWNGNANEGESNSSRLRVKDIFQALKNVLRPYTGLAIIHMHKDSYYLKIIEKISEVFGSHQLMMLEISLNNGIIVVARDRYKDTNENHLDLSGKELEEGEVDKAYREHPLYRSVDHPCQSPTTTLQEITHIAELLNIEEQSWYYYHRSLNCGTVTA